MKHASQAAAVAAGATIIHGVDFSGADGGGAAKIRIAERELAARSAVAIRPRVDRNGLRKAILASQEDGRRHIWRIDAPFGLPLECFTESRPEGLEGDLTWMKIATWMESFPNARAWRGAMRELSRREPKRACDRALSTPMAPMNLRVFKQTFTLITEILLPLAREGVAIDPVTMVDGAKMPNVRVCEGCPASVLRHLGWPHKGYKGGGEPPRRLREDLVRLLRKEGLEIASETAVEAIHDEEGDLLDALILTTPLIEGTLPAELVAQARIEAWVY
ncbi:MAG: hypothetical protein RL591_1197 [Planctomycetota bacterium]|jgi:hypothetical protein